MSGPVEVAVAFLQPPAGDLSTVDGARAHLKRLHDTYLRPRPDQWCARQYVDPVLNIAGGYVAQADHIIVEGKTKAGNRRRMWQVILTVDPKKLAAAVEAIRSPVLNDGFIVLEIVKTRRANDMTLRRIYEVLGVTRVNVAKIETRLITHAKEGNPIVGKTERGLTQQLRSYENAFDIDWKSLRIDLRWLGGAVLRQHYFASDRMIMDTLVVTNVVPHGSRSGWLTFHGHADREAKVGEKGWTEEVQWIDKKIVHRTPFEEVMVESSEGIWLRNGSCAPGRTKELYEAALQFDRDASAFVSDEDMDALAMAAF